MSYDYITFEAAASRHGGFTTGFCVYGWDTYPRSSVLAGQQRKVFLDHFERLDQVQAAYPDAVGSHPLIERVISLNHLPGEDDPVPGGMYPDDY